MSPGRLAQFYHAEAMTVQTPYLVLGILVLAWALLIALTKFPAAASQKAARDENTGVSAGASIGQVLAIGRFRFGVLAMFLYVGAQVGIFMVGRFFGTALMSRIAPR